MMLGLALSVTLLGCGDTSRESAQATATSSEPLSLAANCGFEQPVSRPRQLPASVLPRQTEILPAGPSSEGSEIARLLVPLDLPAAKAEFERLTRQAGYRVIDSELDPVDAEVKVGVGGEVFEFRMSRLQACDATLATVEARDEGVRDALRER